MKNGGLYSGVIELGRFYKVKVSSFDRKATSDFRDKIHLTAEVWFQSQLSVCMWDLWREKWQWNLFIPRVIRYFIVRIIRTNITFLTDSI